MRVIVFNVAAESGGALTILKKYYEEAFRDNSIEWHFIISTPRFESKENVYVHNYPWIKKSWLHRLFFDIFIANRIVRKLEGTTVLSLQNLLIPFLKVKQTVYFHQILPFSEKKYKFNENRLFWIYQNIIGKLIIYSIKKADNVIVQAKWIKNLFINNYNVSPNRITVQSPNLNITSHKKYDTAIKNNKTVYFYPASAAEFKNHRLVVQVAKKLMQEGIDNFEILFTVTGKENSNISELVTVVDKNKLPIKFIGNLSITEVYAMYTKSILLFPSYLESYPLPLEEAKQHDTPIVASNLQFAKEVLAGYKKVKYIDPFTTEDLFLKMKDINQKVN